MNRTWAGVEVSEKPRPPVLASLSVCDPSRFEMGGGPFPGVFDPALTLCDPSGIGERGRGTGNSRKTECTPESRGSPNRKP